MATTIQIIASILYLLTFLIFIPSLALILINKKQLYYRSYILILSTLFTGFFGIIISLSLLYKDFDNPASTDGFNCKFYVFNLYCFQFLIIVPYILRAKRQLMIFSPNAEFNYNNKKRIKSGYFTKIFFSIFMVLFVICLILLFTKISIQSINIAFVDLPACEASKKSNILLQILIYVVVFIYEILSFLYIYKILKSMKGVYFFSREAYSTLISFIIVDILYIFDIIFLRSFTENQYMIVLRLLLKFYFSFIITGFTTIYVHYTSPHTLINVPKECAMDFNLLLVNDTTYKVFAKYLMKYYREGLKLLVFWSEVVLMKNSPNKAIEHENYLKINDKYFSKNGKKVNLELKNNYSMVSSVLSGINGANMEQINDMQEQAFETLKSYYFDEFKQSEEYKELLYKLEEEEKIHSKLFELQLLNYDI